MIVGEFVAPKQADAVPVDIRDTVATRTMSDFPTADQVSPYTYYAANEKPRNGKNNKNIWK